MNTTVVSRLAQQAILSLRRQLHLADLIGERSWHFDTGQLSFGNDLHWQAEILGTESDATNTWLWSWANTGSNLPAALIESSLQMKQLGEQENIREFIEPQLPLTDEINGHVLSMIASGVCDANAYYRAPYEGGAAFLLIKDPEFPRCKEHPLARIATVFPQAIAAFSINDHKLALTSYLEQCGIAYESSDQAVVVKEGIDPVLTALFDDNKRLVKLEAALKTSLE